MAIPICLLSSVAASVLHGRIDCCDRDHMTCKPDIFFTLWPFKKIAPNP